MPIEHIIAIKLKEGVTEQQINDFHVNVQRLLKIEGVQSVVSGKNFTNRADFDLGNFEKKKKCLKFFSILFYYFLFYVCHFFFLGKQTYT